MTFNLKWIFLSLLFFCTFSNASSLLPPPHVGQDEIKLFEQWKLAYQKNVQLKSKRHGDYLNELVYSQSPYLLQHVNNPINWKPWSRELLSRAQKEKKLIFLSIGYSTCHWCHMMEKESFVDLEIAKLLNTHFYSIKVDREELPEIDDYYSAALEQVKGSAGWPISAIITGDGLPVFIDSYISKDKLAKLLTKIDNVWQLQPEFLLTGARNISGLVEQKFNAHLGDNKIDKNLLLNEKINEKLINSLDYVDGGFSGEVKFPSEAMLLYILDQLNRGTNEKLESALKLQLDRMITGGLWDHVSGGFHRYSTDESWTVPHYEKMLYNQAQLMLVYARAYQYFRDPDYKNIVLEIYQFMQARFFDSQSGLFSAIDADFEGKEAEYYLLSKAVLAELDMEPAIFKSYAVSETNNRGVTFAYDLSQSQLNLKKQYRSKIASIRQQKGFPHIDQKVLTGWNALAIKSLVSAAKIIDQKEMAELGKFLANKLWKERYESSTGILGRTGFKGEQNQQRYLEDYAYFCDALLTLYDFENDEVWLKRAKSVQQQALRLFLDNGSLYNISQRETGYSLKKSKDTELISPAAVLYNTISKLDRRYGENTLKKQYSKLTHYMLSKLNDVPLDHLYTALVFNEIEKGAVSDVRYFASAKGKLEFSCITYIQTECQELNINIQLADGWHINSNKPLQDYLIATEVAASEKVRVSYPDEEIVKLGFQEEPLSLYEGSFDIKVKRLEATEQKIYLNLPLQACSDTICLLPETLTLTM